MGVLCPHAQTFKVFRMHNRTVSNFFLSVSMSVAHTISSHVTEYYVVACRAYSRPIFVFVILSSKRRKLPYYLLLSYTTMNARDEFRNVSVTDVSVTDVSVTEAHAARRADLNWRV